jgi:hypothetical protein
MLYTRTKIKIQKAARRHLKQFLFLHRLLHEQIIKLGL